MPDPRPAPGTPGLTFEQFEPGQSLSSPARTVTEGDISLFAGLSGDYNPLHTDAEFARTTPFGRPIAHGMLGLSIATGLAARLGFLDGTALAFLGVEWKFRKPVFPGDTIRADIDVGRCRPAPAMGGGMVTFHVRLRNQADEVVQRGTWEILVASAAGGEDGR